LQDLISELKSELSGRFEKAILALFLTPSQHDAQELRSAMKVSGITCLWRQENLRFLTFAVTFKVVLNFSFKFTTYPILE